MLHFIENIFCECVRKLKSLEQCSSGTLNASLSWYLEKMKHVHHISITIIESTEYYL